ncbi:stage II sporulation protein P [Lysinibacillus sp. 54212]|uniref:stage II sporulation protein P n=1 Tax=Lysinibacillus sp. 54212 TaxID=3119829 RepID=UPI002FCC8FFD
MKNMKRVLIFFLLLFLLPIVTGQLPLPNNEQTSMKPQVEQKVVHASAAPIVDVKEILLFFTHSHEAYKPILQTANVKVANQNKQHNIQSFQGLFEEQFETLGIKTHTLGTDIMIEMEKQGKKFNQAYKVARPFVKTAVEQYKYDLILDIHRDSLTKKATTITLNETPYAKIAFVVGAEHPTYEWNLAYAEALSKELNALVPGISRGIIKKQGDGVDGIYNQDLAPQMLLIEMGGIDNTEEEIKRTIAVLTQAIANMFTNERLQDA